LIYAPPLHNNVTVKYLYINSDYITEYLQPNGVLIPTAKQRNGFHVISNPEMSGEYKSIGPSIIVQESITRFQLTYFRPIYGRIPIKTIANMYKAVVNNSLLNFQHLL